MRSWLFRFSYTCSHIYSLRHDVFLVIITMAGEASSTPDKKFSFAGLIFAVIVTALGSPILQLPSCAREIGPWPAVGLLVLVALVNSEVARLMSETCAILEERETDQHYFRENSADKSDNPGPASDQDGAERHKEKTEGRATTSLSDGDDGRPPSPPGRGAAASWEGGESEPLLGPDEVLESRQSRRRSSSPSSDGKNKNPIRTSAHEPPVLAINSYARYLAIVFAREKGVLVVARTATYVGYFALMVITDILFTRVFLQIVEQCAGSDYDEWTLKLAFSGVVLLPLHLWQSASSEGARTFVTTTLAEFVPYVFAVIVALLFYELWLQDVGDRKQIVQWVETGATPNGDKNSEENARLAQSFAPAWHADYGLLGLRGETSSAADVSLTVLRIAALQSYSFMATSLVPTLRGRARRPEQMAAAHLAAVLLAVCVFGAITLYGYHVFGNATPDLLTEGFRRNRVAPLGSSGGYSGGGSLGGEGGLGGEDDAVEPWFVRVYGYSRKEEVRKAATAPQHCTDRRVEVTDAKELFTQNWPQNRGNSAAGNNGRDRPIEWAGEERAVDGNKNITAKPAQNTSTETASCSCGNTFVACLRRYLWPVVVALGRLVCALLVPHIVEVVCLVSSVSLVLTEILLPLAGYYKVRGLQPSSRPTAPAREGRGAQAVLLLRRLFHVFVLVFGFLMFVLATYAGVDRLVQKIAADHNTRNHPAAQGGPQVAVCNGG
eukprot:g11605.t1